MPESIPPSVVPAADDARYARIMDAMPPMIAALRDLPAIACPARRLDTAMQVLNFSAHLSATARQELEKLKGQG